MPLASHRCGRCGTSLPRSAAPSMTGPTAPAAALPASPDSLHLSRSPRAVCDDRAAPRNFGRLRREPACGAAHLPGPPRELKLPPHTFEKRKDDDLIGSPSFGTRSAGPKRRRRRRRRGAATPRGPPHRRASVSRSPPSTRLHRGTPTGSIQIDLHRFRHSRAEDPGDGSVSEASAASTAGSSPSSPGLHRRRRRPLRDERPQDLRVHGPRREDKPPSSASTTREARASRKRRLARRLCRHLPQHPRVRVIPQIRPSSGSPARAAPSAAITGFQA